MSMNNKITTLGYFKNRMRAAGYTIMDVFDKYSDLDPRAWTVILDPGCASIFITLYKNASQDDIKKSELDSFYFEMYDGGQFLPTNMKYKTNSMEVLLTYLNDKNIINKSERYSDKTSP